MACNTYSLDMNGTTFGVCKCGHPKSEHTPGVGVPHEQAWQEKARHASGIDAKAPPAEEGVPEPEVMGNHPCGQFVINTNAEFGTCVCGFKKAEHGKPGAPVAAAPKPAPPPAAASPPPAAAAAGPCHTFELDLQGAKFGHCKCGYSKEEHKAAGTITEPERRVFAGGHAAEKRPTIVAPKGKKGKQAKPCSKYEVDIAGKTFGDCLCGHGRALHPEFGGHVEPDPEPVAAAPAPEVIVRDGLHPCVKFELDMTNDKGGFGLCLCRFTRLDHEHFEQNPAEWLKVKEGLTAPKEFT